MLLIWREENIKPGGFLLRRADTESFDSFIVATALTPDELQDYIIKENGYDWQAES
jgi:hypothetical protein